MQTKKSDDRTNLRIILIVLAALVALTAVLLLTYHDRIFGEDEVQEAVQDGELEPGARDIPLAQDVALDMEATAQTEDEPEQEVAPRVEELPLQEPSIEKPADVAPAGPDPQFVEVGAKASPRPEASDDASLQLVKNYLTVTGGKAAHEQLHNVVATGSIQEASLLRNFHLIESRDGRRHLRYSWKFLGRAYEELYVFDGLHAWSQKLKPELGDAEPYSGPAGTHFIHHRWLLQPFVQPRLADYVFKYQGGAPVSGRPTHVVVGFGKKNERSWFYFDQEKFLLLRWGGFGPVGGNQEPMDYRSVRFKRAGGVLLPQEIDLLVENDVFGKITIETIKTNQALDDINFTMPESTVPVLRQRPLEPR